MNKKLLTPAFLGITIMNFLVLTANNLFVLYPLYLQDIGKTRAEIGFIMGIYSLAGIIARFLIGDYLDRIGRRFFVRLGLGVFLLCTFLYAAPVTDNLYLYFVRILHGLGFGVYFTSVFTWSSDFAPKGHTAEAVGIFGVSGLITIASGPLIGEAVLRWSQGNFLHIFASMFILWTIGILISLPMKELHQPADQKSMIRFAELFKKQGIIQASFLGIIFGLAMAAVFTFIAPYVRSQALGNASAFYIPYTIAAILVRILFGKNADTNKNAFLIPGFLIMGTGLFLTGTITTGELLPYIGFFTGIAHGMVFPAMVASMLDKAGQANKGRGMGLINASTDLGSLSGASGMGVIADLINYPAMYRIAGITVASTFLLYLAGTTRNKNTKTP